MAGIVFVWRFVCSLLIFICLTTGLSNGADEKLKFLVLGDWGGLPNFPYRTLIEKSVATQMGKFANSMGTRFQLALGDNFYFDGVKDVNDKRFQETFEQVFTAPSMQTPWYLVAGNHDHRGNVSAQIAYSAKSHRWFMPDYNYTLKYTIPNSNASVTIIMIDTILLCGNTDHDFSGEPPQGPTDILRANNQWSWIEDNLRKSRSEYLIVAGHFPVWSVAEHGPTQCLTKQLLPMLHKYRATSYFSGHDHNLQHLVYTMTNTTVDYFVVGSANFIDPSLAHQNSVPSKSLRFHWANQLALGGFGYVETTTQNMTFSFIEASGRLLYQRVMLPRKL